MLAVFLSLSRQVDVEAPELASHLAVDIEPPVTGEILLLEESPCTQHSQHSHPHQRDQYQTVTHRWDRGS